MPSGIRPWGWNKNGSLNTQALARLRAARIRHLTPEHQRALEETIALGERNVVLLRALLHGGVERRDVKSELRPGLQRFADEHYRLTKPGGIAEVYVGLAGVGPLGGGAQELTALWDGGVHAPATVLAVRDARRDSEDRPKVSVTISVAPPDQPAFQIEQVVNLWRDYPSPRPGQTLDVAYDPRDLKRFTFRAVDLYVTPGSHQ